MRPLLFPFGLTVALVLVASSGRADDSTPLTGDLRNGATRYRLDCATCHGLDGGGDGPLANGLNPHPAVLRDGGYLWSHSDAQLLGAITGEALVAGAPPKAHNASALDAHDILAWIKAPVLEVGAAFPEAVEYVAHIEEFDADGKDRAAQIVGRVLTPAEAEVMLFVPYRHDPESTVQPDGHPTKIGEDAPSLYGAKPRRRLGYAAYETLDLHDGPLQVLLAMDNESKLIDVLTMPSPDPKVERAREKTEKLLKTYIGSGGRMDKKPIEPQERHVHAPKDVQDAMVLAFERLLEGDAMFQKEELDRFALDPDAFKFPKAADQPDVQFKFKEQKQK